MRMEVEEMEAYHFIKLVVPSQGLRVLDVDKSFVENNVKSETKIVLLGQSSFTWDLNYKGSNI